MTRWVCFSLLLCCYCWDTAITTPTSLAEDLSEFLLWTRSWSIGRQKRAFLGKYSNCPVYITYNLHLKKALCASYKEDNRCSALTYGCSWLVLKEHQIKQWHNPQKHRKHKLNLLQQQTWLTHRTSSQRTLFPTFDLLWLILCVKTVLLLFTLCSLFFCYYTTAACLLHGLEKMRICW